jgi:hypothetical protein
MSIWSAWKTASNAGDYLPSRSRSRNRIESSRVPSSAATFLACWVVQSGSRVGRLFRIRAASVRNLLSELSG